MKRYEWNKMGKGVMISFVFFMVVMEVLSEEMTHELSEEIIRGNYLNIRSLILTNHQVKKNPNL